MLSRVSPRLRMLIIVVSKRFYDEGHHEHTVCTLAVAICSCTSCCGGRGGWRLPVLASDCLHRRTTVLVAHVGICFSNGVDADSAGGLNLWSKSHSWNSVIAMKKVSKG